MIRPAPRARSGITLTEILISILIMGIGLVSLATLFPIGLERIRSANRFSRSTLLTETAQNDTNGRGLMAPNSFRASGLYSVVPPPPQPLLYPPSITFYDPFIQDLPLPSPTIQDGSGFYSDPARGVYRGWGMDGGSHNPFPAPPGFPMTSAPNHPAQTYQGGAGLVVAYDPLFRQIIGLRPGTAPEARFASGISFLRNNPTPTLDPGGLPPSAHGLQRVTNFDPSAAAPSSPAIKALLDQTVAGIFVSQEDIVWLSEGESTKGVNYGSPVLPDISNPAGPALSQDYSYTWMLTVRRSDVSNIERYSGDVVVFHNRPFSFQPTNSPFGGPVDVWSGERVVEAIFGYNGTLSPLGTGYGNGDDRTVLLRWPASEPDPEIRVGSWIADVTYERFRATERFRFEPESSLGAGDGIALGLRAEPAQRCYWYRVAKKTNAEADPGFSADGGILYRRMLLTMANPVRARTLLTTIKGTAANPVQPVHVNAALVSPYVVNVFTDKVFFSK